MQCQICKSKAIKPYKVVDSVLIYLCTKCHVAFLDPSTPRKKTSHIYSFLDYKKRESQFRNRFRTTVHLIQRFIKGKKILEVGAGFGLLSSMLSSEGFEVDALEPDVEPIYLKGLTVHIFKDHLEDYVKKTKVKYDAVILYDVLEHVDSPKDTVKLFENLLNDKGIVIIQTPNYESLMAKVVRNWSWWMVEDHRFFFSKKSLDLLFNNRSWKQLFYRTYEEWPDFKKNLDGNFVMIQNALVRKCIKALFFGFFAPFYVVGKHQLWKCGRGGLHMAIWQYNKR